MFKTQAPFTVWIGDIENTQIAHAEDLEVVLPIHNLIKYSDHYLKTSETF